MSKIQEEFKQQLQAFIADTSVFEEYRRYTPFGDKVVVQLFKFDAGANSEDVFSKGKIVIQDPVTGVWKNKEEVISSKVFPICKVLKVGIGVKEPSVKVGNLYIVKHVDVVGDSWNPDYLLMVQTYTKRQGDSGQLMVPQELKVKIPKLEINWADYKFSMPDRIGEETETDSLIYLIPTLKLEAAYEPIK